MAAWASLVCTRAAGTTERLVVPDSPVADCCKRRWALDSVQPYHHSHFGKASVAWVDLVAQEVGDQVFGVAKGRGSSAVEVEVHQLA